LKESTFVHNPQFWIRTTSPQDSLSEEGQKLEIVEILILQPNIFFNDLIGLYMFKTKRGLSCLPSSLEPAVVSSLLDACDITLISMAGFDFNTEAYLCIEIESAYDYVVVPCTSQPGSEARFELRLYTETHSTRSLQLPGSVTVCGSWERQTAAGCAKYSSWPNNPQYALSIFHSPSESSLCSRTVSTTPSTAKLRVTLRQSEPALHKIGYYVLCASDRRRRCSISSEEILLPYHCPFALQSQVEREVELPLNSAETVTHYTLVPCTLKHNQRASFSLTVEMATGNRSWFPFLLTACDVSRQCVQGEWKGQSAGGSAEYPSFPFNPQYLLRRVATSSGHISPAHQTATYSVVLCVESGTDTISDLQPLVKLYLATFREGPVAVITPDTLVAQSVFAPRQVSVELRASALPPEGLVVIPCTAQPGHNLRFSLSVLCPTLELIPLPPFRVLSVKGDWLTTGGGGLTHCPTWHNNPHFWLTLSRPHHGLAATLSFAPLRVWVLLTQSPHTTEDVLSPVHEDIGVLIYRAKNRQGFRKKYRLDDAIVLQRPHFVERKYIAVAVEVTVSDGEEGYVVVPMTLHANVPLNFELAVLLVSTPHTRTVNVIFEEITHVEAMQWHSFVFRSEWSLSTAGGRPFLHCDSDKYCCHSTVISSTSLSDHSRLDEEEFQAQNVMSLDWTSNPFFTFALRPEPSIAHPAHGIILLRLQTYQEHIPAIGVCLFRSFARDANSFECLKHATLLYSSPFIKSVEVVLEFVLPRLSMTNPEISPVVRNNSAERCVSSQERSNEDRDEVAYIVVPCTEQRGKIGSFTLTLLTSSPLHILSQRTAAQDAPSTALSPLELYRLNILDEIYTSEVTYVNGLRLLVEHFKPAFEKAPPKLLSPSEVQTLFRHLPTLYTVNTQFLSELKQMLCSQPYPHVGPLFVKFSDFLKMYADYCAHREVQIKLLEECSRRKGWREFLQPIELQVGKLTLGDYLIMPIQRIPRYILLLENLMKSYQEERNSQPELHISAPLSNVTTSSQTHPSWSLPVSDTNVSSIQELSRASSTPTLPTKRSSVDGRSPFLSSVSVNNANNRSLVALEYEQLRECLRRMKGVAEAINEKTRWHQASDAVVMLQRNIYTTDKSSGHSEPLLLAVPHRRYIREGSLRVLSKAAKWVKCYVFLFNDLLLVTIPRSKRPKSAEFVRQYDLKRKLPLNSRSTLNKYLSVLQFSITVEHKTYIFEAETEHEKEKWIHDLSVLLVSHSL